MEGAPPLQLLPSLLPLQSLFALGFWASAGSRLRRLVTLLFSTRLSLDRLRRRGEESGAWPSRRQCIVRARAGEGRWAGCYVINPSSGEAISPQLRHRLVCTAPPCTCVSALYVTWCAFAPLNWHPRNVAKLLFCFWNCILLYFGADRQIVQ